MLTFIHNHFFSETNKKRDNVDTRKVSTCYDKRSVRYDENNRPLDTRT